MHQCQPFLKLGYIQQNAIMYATSHKVAPLDQHRKSVRAPYVEGQVYLERQYQHIPPISPTMQ